MSMSKLIVWTKVGGLIERPFPDNRTILSWIADIYYYSTFLEKSQEPATVLALPLRALGTGADCTSST